MPDYDRARNLSPHLFPPDAKAEAQRLKQLVEVLANRLAKVQKKTVKEVLEEAKTSMGKEAPVVKDPPTDTGGTSDTGGAPVADSTGAQFFANKNRDKYYPIDMKNKGSFATLKEENVVYFNTKEEAEAANFKPID